MSKRNVWKQLQRIIISICLSLLTAAVFLPGKVIAVNAGTSISKKPSAKILANYVKKYVTKTKNCPDPDKNNLNHYYYELNVNAIKKLPVKSRAKVLATMYNCASGSLSSKKKKTSDNIYRLGKSYTEFYDFECSEAADFFAAYSQYVMPGEQTTVKDHLEKYIGSYLFSKELKYITSTDKFDQGLSSYDQVLDLFTVTDGKITKGAKNCLLIEEKDTVLRVGSGNEKHHTATYMVIKAGTVEYSTLDTSAGKKKTIEKKYISIRDAIDKELVKTEFTGQQLKNAFEIEAAAKSDASKIHKTLLAGKEQLIKINAPEEKAKKIMSELGDMVADINGGGYEFLYEMKPTASDKCTYVLISEDSANVYNKCAEFYERLEKQYKQKAAWKLEEITYEHVWYQFDYDEQKYVALHDYEETHAYRDYLKYPDESQRALRACYDVLVRNVLYVYRDSEIWGCKQVNGYDQPETEKYNKVYNTDYEHLKVDAIIKDETDHSVTLCSFEEFLGLPDLDEIIKDFRHLWFFEPNEYTEQQIEYSRNDKSELQLLPILLEKPFAELNDLEKLYAIYVSELFMSTYSYPEDGKMQVVYTYRPYWDADNNAKALQNLMDGKADGLCRVYSQYEYLVFKTLGFDCYMNSAQEVNHAWTVLRLTNRAGKELWIPFDYGIGPSLHLSVSSDTSDDHRSEEDRNYALYLRGIKGAPDHKNFTLADFLE